ncbi:hypothetical protein [Magnetospira sp. QH-2]|uniref:hypothetical protein n=1 Tax=Magnetospira sp. (strain QH-2) TaxID=1288970 RepID=UPI0003E81252|nr:hypothetical protein [Magnetospira sp. QH-2]CCQ73118.1 protein of unknown function [Magnetospira sp. QH-2]
MSDKTFQDKVKNLSDRIGQEDVDGLLDERVLDELLLDQGTDTGDDWIHTADGTTEHGGGGGGGMGQRFSDEDWVHFVDRESAEEEESPSDQKKHEPDNVADAVDAEHTKKGWRARLKLRT